ncbi:VOC family protein [Patulibacter sp. SYSU D01012]|uniref:VOC family protein n=1 Tax=Patulibacter sp. SYSU D01012 TaxID=2817381 RepID=UPI001B30412C|nr:VOC family protein [Patulibacter sp. SYSU D01012]
MSSSPRPAFYPFLRYADAPAMLAWLPRAFGFRVRVAYPGPDGTIAHAELELDDGIVMVGSLAGDAPPPDGDGRGEARGVYVAVDDADAHHAAAVAAGAEIVSPLQDTDYGSRDYAARDPEGRLWHFGTYRPVGGTPAHG